MFRAFGQTCLCLLTLAAAGVAPARAATLVIQPSNQDAFILKDQPNRVTGARNTRLRVEASPPGTNKIRRGLVQYEVLAPVAPEEPTA